MTISSRTPEGRPNECRICGQAVCIEPSSPPGDAPCPSCGQLLWRFQSRLGDVNLDTRLSADLLGADAVVPSELAAADSLNTVELVMRLEEEFDLEISDEDAERIRTIGDAIRYIRRQQDEP